MDIHLYLIPFIKALVISTLVAAALVLFSCKLGKKNRKGTRHLNKNTCRIGGIAIIASFVIVLFSDPNLVITTNLWGVLIASIIIAIVGVWDDFSELHWRTQLFYQIVIAILIFILGVRVEYITNPLGGFFFLNIGKYLIPSLIFVIFWMILIINSINWLDGIDGLSGGVTLIGVLTIFFLSLKPEVNQPPVGIISLAVAGSIIGFLIFNLHPAKILAGTSGSMFMGFILAVLAIFAGTKIATASLVLAVPIIDSAWVVMQRVKSGKSIFKPDNRHLHFKLIEIGWSQRKISLFFYTITILISLVALNTRAIGKLITISLVSIIMLSALYFLDKKIKNK